MCRLKLPGACGRPRRVAASSSAAPAVQVLAFSLEHDRPTQRLGRLAVARLGMDATPNNPIGAPSSSASCKEEVPCGARPPTSIAQGCPLAPLPPGRAERKRMTQRRNYWRRRLKDLQMRYPEGIPEEASAASYMLFFLSVWPRPRRRSLPQPERTGSDWAGAYDAGPSALPCLAADVLAGCRTRPVPAMERPLDWFPRQAVCSFLHPCSLPLPAASSRRRRTLLTQQPTLFHACASPADIAGPRTWPPQSRAAGRGCKQGAETQGASRGGRRSAPRRRRGG